ncbi:MAG TPA: hypothetical protein VK464_14285 [Symbiobacteriaceae bacterium]|nr:hypothetical protein [Symbiobacteriaceae bacterium]
MLHVSDRLNRWLQHSGPHAAFPLVIRSGVLPPWHSAAVPRDRQALCERAGGGGEAEHQHLGVAIRPASTDPNIRGFGRDEIHFKCWKDPEYALELAHEHHHAATVLAGELFTLEVTPDFGSKVTDPEYIWVAPHGMSFEETDGPRATMVAPQVPYLTDTWVSLYIRNGEVISRPHKLEIKILPAATGAKQTTAQPGANRTAVR